MEDLDLKDLRGAFPHNGTMWCVDPCYADAEHADQQHYGASLKLPVNQYVAYWHGASRFGEYSKCPLFVVAPEDLDVDTLKDYIQDAVQNADKIGTVSVDSGQVMFIGELQKATWKPGEFYSNYRQPGVVGGEVNDYHNACVVTCYAERGLLYNSIPVTSGFGGDGTYNVYQLTDPNNVVVGMFVAFGWFDEDRDEEDEDDFDETAYDHYNRQPLDLSRYDHE